MKRKIISVLLVLSLTVSFFAVSAFAAEEKGEFVLSSPYGNVDWEKMNAYKGNLHTHSAVSDGSESFKNMIYAAYAQDYDLLAFSEHGITGRAWNKTPFIRPLYLYTLAGGHDKKPLSTEEFNAIQNGTAVSSETGKPRGKGMLCVTGANELNAVTITKCHVNGYFLPENVGNMDWGFENGFDYALLLVEKNGGLSHINHPGDWLETKKNPSAVSDPENVELFADCILRYDSCLGVEAVNGFTSLTRYDRIFWDNLLMYCLPYGKNVFGFAGADAHETGRLNSCFMYFMMDDLSQESLRKAMENGEFFGATHTVVANDVIGPETDLNAPEGINQPLAKVKSLEVSGHKITLKAENASYVNWISNGKVIAKNNLEAKPEATLDLDEFETSDMLYVRCEIYNENGMVFSQPIVLERGGEKPVYKSTKTAAEKLSFALKSTRLYVIVQKLVSLVKSKMSK
ncbi:MAG: hypothetical protein Q4D20_00295 [Clostridia bacterium]|nr:hypothetical protein [Clostridia bacterium]